MAKLTPRDNEELEMLIDARGVATVLEAIAQICHEKAEHAQSTWQDKELAADWRIVGGKIGKLADQLPDIP